MGSVLSAIKKAMMGSGKKNDQVWAIICAAGSSTRMGQDKLMMELAGKPVLFRTVQAMNNSSCIDAMVVVVHKDKLEQVAHMLQSFPKVKAVVVGGNTRTESVANGLEALPEEAGIVAVHDGARPFVTEKVIADAVAAAKNYGAAVPAVPVKDTIKQVKSEAVINTPDRSELRAVQTPQVFHKDILRAAISNAAANSLAVTDDAQAVELLGLPVYITQGDEKNIKITTPFDVVVGEAMLRNDNA